MPRKKTGPVQINFQFATNQISMTEAASLVKWNPVSSIETMNEVKNRITSPIEVNLWNRKAKQINNFLDSIERQRYYNRNQFWGVGVIPTRLEQLEEEMDLEDWVALQKMTKGIL